MNPTPPAGLYILGCGGHARSVADVAVSLGIERLVFVVPGSIARPLPDDFPVIEALPETLELGFAVFPGVGDAGLRRQLCEQAPLGRLATLVSRAGTLGAYATIGAGSFVAHHAHVGPAAQIGSGVIVNTGAVVEHDCVLGDYTHVSVNATIAGSCRIGENVLIGAGAVVIDGITITDHVIVGAGATVIRDIPSAGTYVGTPARKL